MHDVAAARSDTYHLTLVTAPHPAPIVGHRPARSPRSRPRGHVVRRVPPPGRFAGVGAERGGYAEGPAGARTFTRPAGPSVRTRRRRLFAGACCLALVTGLSLSAGATPSGADAAPTALAPPAPTPVFQTSVVPDSAPTTAVATPTVPQPGGEVSDPAGGVDNANEVRQENRRIWLVVGGLVAVAVALALVTVRYWRHTKPVAVPAPSSRDRASARPVASGPEASRSGEPRRSRAGPVIAEPSAGRRSRRSVAGADHAGADEGWEPRGTGEHERVEVSASVARSRPSRAQRRSAYQAGRRR